MRWGLLTACWQQATLDFIQLMRINFRSSFQCGHGVEFLTADGISLGYHIQQAYIEKPWAADPGSAAVWGSQPPDRLLLRPPALRKLMWAYASSAGLSDSELATLQAGIRALPPGDSGV